MEPQVSPDLAGKVLAAEKRNVIKGVGEGGTLPTPLRREMQMTALTPDLADQLRAAALLSKYCAGQDLTPAQWQEVRASHPGFASEPPPPSTSAAAAEPVPAETPRAKLSKADEERYSKLYGKQWRQLRRWIDRGDEVGDPCPLHDPAAMPTWWSKHMKWRVPPEIEAAAAAAARIPAPDPTMPAAADPATSDSAGGPAPSASAAASGDGRSTPLPPVGKSINLEDFDPEEGDRLRELKQIQSARFAALRDDMKAGHDTTVAENRYLKICETIDKIETRVIARLVKRELYILRADIERDIAANAELLRQLDQSQLRRVLERCSSLSEAQKSELAIAIEYTNRSKERILSTLNCLHADDLLRELAAA